MATPPNNDDSSSTWDSDEDNDPLELLGDGSFEKGTVHLTPLKSVLPVVTPPAETTPTQEVNEHTTFTPQVGGVPHEPSGATIDEEISHSNCSDMDYVEDVEDIDDVVDFGSYVPSTHSAPSTPTRFTHKRPPRSPSGNSDGGKTPLMTPEHTDNTIVSPLSTSHFTTDFLSPNTSGPAPRSLEPEVGVVSSPELSLASDDDDDVTKLLEAASNLPVAVSECLYMYVRTCVCTC